MEMFWLYFGYNNIGYKLKYLVTAITRNCITTINYGYS